MSENKVIQLKNVRLSFPELFKAKAFQEGQNPKFSASFLIDGSTKEGKATIKMIEKEIDSLAKSNWPKGKPKSLKICLQDGDTKDYDGYADMMYVSSNNDTRPVVVDRKRSPVTEADDLIYAGCYVNASLNLWCQDNQWGKRVNAGLRAVQFVKGGEAFGGARVDVEDEFDEIDEDDLEEDDLI
jgi:hypothetical protein